MHGFGEHRCLQKLAADHGWEWTPYLLPLVVIPWIIAALRSAASDPRAELFVPVVQAAARQTLFAAPGWAARVGGPRGGRQYRAQSPNQEGAGGRGQHQKRRQGKESEHYERCGAPVGEQRSAAWTWGWMNLCAGRGE